jgi:hypothetical protein
MGGAFSIHKTQMTKHLKAHNRAKQNAPRSLKAQCLCISLLLILTKKMVASRKIAVTFFSFSNSRFNFLFSSFIAKNSSLITSKSFCVLSFDYFAKVLSSLIPNFSFASFIPISFARATACSLKEVS